MLLKWLANNMLDLKLHRSGVPAWPEYSQQSIRTLSPNLPESGQKFCAIPTATDISIAHSDCQRELGIDGPAIRRVADALVSN